MRRGQIAQFVERFHQSKVAQLGDAGSREQDVAGLDIAVHEPAALEVFQRHGDVERDAGSIPHGQGAGAIEQELAARTIHVFENQEMPAGRRVALGPERANDVREADHFTNLGFARESRRGGAVLTQMVGKNFQRDGPPLAGVVSEIDGAHSAVAELPQDAETPQAPRHVAVERHRRGTDRCGVHGSEPLGSRMSRNRAGRRVRIAAPRNRFHHYGVGGSCVRERPLRV